ncbi:MAG: VC0807 family protein [Granulosicoccaceae bacterium]
MNKSEKKQRPFVDLIISIVIPTLILMKFSGEQHLGPTGGLIVALAFPVCYGLYELIGNGTRNWVALLGVISVLLTGSIGLLKLDPKWLAVKEAAIPLAIGIGVLVAKKMGYPLLNKLLLNPSVVNIHAVEDALQQKGSKPEFDSALDKANYFFAGTFFFSAIMNFILAKSIVTSTAGTEAFNIELGKMNALSYPVIAIPSMIMMFAIFYFIWRTVSRLTGLTLEQVMVGAEEETDESEKDGNK